MSEPERWKRACYATWYQCEIQKCPRGGTEYQDRRAMESHLGEEHSECVPPRWKRSSTNSKFKWNDTQLHISIRLMRSFERDLVTWQKARCIFCD